ncbi:hypothetical protein TALC_01486 [Thermoplasmatales archaeon BRNA1]|nr:hypothetical protein TALC_01486 [Thermoplasmatales archaeon BRNA1]
MANAVESSVESSMARNRSLIERIGLYIPFYRGYKQKNLRRDEDRAIRNLIAQVLDRAKVDLKNAERATVGDLQAMRDNERILSKVDRYYSDVKKAVNGYSGFHDSVKILETELDALIEWDAKLIDDVERLKSQTEQMSADADAGDSIATDMKIVERIIDDLIDNYRQRENVMRGFVESAE